MKVYIVFSVDSGDVPTIDVIFNSEELANQYIEKVCNCFEYLKKHHFCIEEHEVKESFPF